MNSHIRILAIAVTLVLRSSLVSGFVPGDQLPLYYDVTSGNITIDTTNISGGEFVAYSIKHSKAPSLGIRYLAENHTPFMDNLFSPVSVGNNIAETSWPGEPMPPGVYSLGNILPPNLSREELTRYFGETGHLSKPFSRSAYTYVAYGSFELEPAQYHVFEINYSPSPFLPLNDPNPVVPAEVRWATNATLGYDPADGSLYLDTSGPQGGKIFAYEIRLRQDMFRADNFHYVASELLSNISTNSIAEVSQIAAGVHPLGAVLPAGLESEQLSQLIDVARFVGEPGHGFGAIDYAISGHPLTISLVPEPNFRVAMLLPFMLFALSRRRRRDV